MSVLNNLIADLRQKRLWPVAVGLLVALVAVPVLLSRSASSAPLAGLPQSGPVASAADAVHAVNVGSTSSRLSLKGSGRDPFTQQKLASAKKGATSTSRATGSSGSSGSTKASTTTASGGAGVTTTTTTTTTTVRFPTGTPKPGPIGLSATQSYGVTFAITNSAGGLDTTDPLERLSVLPSEQQPLLIELGVLTGGQRVLFAVQRGTVVRGPGTCTPGPVDCEILSLAQNQIESLSMQSPAGTVSVALFAVTAIRADQHSSAAAADAARRMESAAGRRLLNASGLSALSLFRYQPSVGAVVDLRNLTVGGS